MQAVESGILHHLGSTPAEGEGGEAPGVESAVSVPGQVGVVIGGGGGPPGVNEAVLLEGT